MAHLIHDLAYVNLNPIYPLQKTIKRPKYYRVGFLGKGKSYKNVSNITHAKILKPESIFLPRKRLKIKFTSFPASKWKGKNQLHFSHHRTQTTNIHSKVSLYAKQIKISVRKYIAGTCFPGNKNRRLQTGALIFPATQNACVYPADAMTKINLFTLRFELKHQFVTLACTHLLLKLIFT
jgi:hypothetical protein